MTTQVFGSQLAVAAVAVTAGALAEAVVSASRALSTSISEAALTAWWTLGLWALPGALMALSLAWVLGAVCEAEPLAVTLRQQWSLPARRDALLVGLFAASALLSFVFVVTRASARFHNLELAAASSAVSVLVGAAVLALMVARTLGILRRKRAAGTEMRALTPLTFGFSALVLVSLALTCWTGLLQLDARLLAAPSAFLAAFAICDGSGWLRTRRGGVLFTRALAGMAALAGLSLVGAGRRTDSALAQRGAWSPVLITFLQQVSDFDRDGYSGFLGGGDCAPLDAAINPAALEIVGDGIDNNCIAGDAGKSYAPRRPRWNESAHGSPSNLNVVVVTIETLRHDHASFLHAAHDTTPTLRALAAESLVFTRMYSAAPVTRLALASLFSSYAPSEIDWLAQEPAKRMRRLGPKTPWLPELLRARGYETIAVLTDFSAFTPQEDAGFERGFEHYDITTKLQYQGGTMWGFPAAEQVDKALGYVQHAQRPFLLWLHLFEPHFRYEQPPDAPVFGSDELSRYDAEIWHVDRQLRRLIDGLRAQRAWDETVLLVTGDHGEAFGEHDDRWHGSNLHDPQVRPAALLRIPGATGKRLDVSVTFTDLAPTLARVLGDRQTFDQLHGRSLAPLMHHATLPVGEDDFVVESFSVDDGHAYQAALIAYPLKLIYVETGKSFRLFDLLADPNEQNPLDPLTDPRGAPLMVALVGFLERTRSAP